MVFVVSICAHWLTTNNALADLRCEQLRCEYRQSPHGIDEAKPRLCWQVKSELRGQKQSAYRIIVASSVEKLEADQGDVWDSGKVDSNQTLHFEYQGRPLNSGERCYWKVKSWNQNNQASAWSPAAIWTMGLLDESDWQASYISYPDTSPIFKDRESHFLPPAIHYRKQFVPTKKIQRATVYATALGIYQLELNGQAVSDHYFAPGWTDYRQRAYYNTYDVTELVRTGENVIGATVADGWYSGYVGFGLLVGIGTEKIGRYTYGKTPSLMAQLEIEFEDGTKQTVVTDESWKYSADGPFRQADLLMGEFYDARMEHKGWSKPGFDDALWSPAILARDAGPQQANFYEFENPEPGQGPKIKPKPVDLGFQRPRLESFPGNPVVVTEELAPKSITERNGKFIFDLGQNFAGNIRLNLQGKPGQQLTIRYAEMLHPDGRMMTENLRKARAMDYYICKGDPQGETYTPQFTFHGFQFVEIEGLTEKPTNETLTGLVIHSETRMTSSFECSDPMVNQLFKNVVWTQRANFIDLPTDCPQRDERMGWTGDAQAYVATAAYNADVGAFFTKWNRELMESQRPSGAFPGYAPFPFQHGWDFGSAWSDAGVICPWTIWQAYGDTRMIDRCWEPMTKFMDWRNSTSVNDLGIAHGNGWGDWLSQGETTPLDYIDTVYYAITTRMMAEMAEATGRSEQATQYREQLSRTKAAFIAKYVKPDGSINVSTQTAQALALFADLVPIEQRAGTGRHLAKMLHENGNHMATGFLGTRPLLPALTASGQNDLAVFLLQSHEFPSWGYEIDQGATSIWERWDSFTKEDGFGRHNAAMNSFSHYAFGAVCEWMFRTLAGIDSEGVAYETIIIRPHPPRPNSNQMHQPIDWVKASYDSIRGTINSEWRLAGDQFELSVVIPANTQAKVFLPISNVASIRESGQSLDGHPHVSLLKSEDNLAILSVDSGAYRFTAQSGLRQATVALKTAKPKDNSMNPDQVELENAKKIAHWDFSQKEALAQWNLRNNVNVATRDGKTYLTAAGPDPQFALRLANELRGDLVLEIRAFPDKGADCQLYWASESGGFNPTQQQARQLKPTEQINSYLFRFPANSKIGQLRFDPFAKYDEHANQGVMQIESISIYRLPSSEPEKVEDNAAAKNGEQAKKRFPNILLFLAEDQGAHLGRLGTEGLQTPHIDALAEQGVYFKNAFVVYPVCSASKAAMYTGLHSHTNGILNNTHNFHMPASQVTKAQKALKLAQTNRVRDIYLTLPEILAANGYYQGVTHKLHVLPNTKFPYDEFLGESPLEVDRFLKTGVTNEQPWFLLVNMPYSHRPYPNSDKQSIRVDPESVQLPSYLPDTPLVRQDWAEYLAGIEKVDEVVGRTMQQLRATKQLDDTIIIYVSDHGPTFPHGKMTLYDLGLRVPVIVCGPGIKPATSNELVTELDILPTLLDLVSDADGAKLTVPDSAVAGQLPYNINGKSLEPILSQKKNPDVTQFVFAEISNRGPLPNDGIQERSIFDGRWKLIYRTNVQKRWRQVNADSRQFKVWGNRTYAETIRTQKEFPEAYRVLQEMDPQELSGNVPKLELYDLANDPDEMKNLARSSEHQKHRLRLMSGLKQWARDTRDQAISF
ncbi:MAG: family 78 glycoside hydrolase catalytic domain [Planctomycetota bacterium]